MSHYEALLVVQVTEPDGRQVLARESLQFEASDLRTAYSFAQRLWESAAFETATPTREVIMHVKETSG